MMFNMRGAARALTLVIGLSTSIGLSPAARGSIDFPCDQIKRLEAEKLLVSEAGLSREADGVLVGPDGTILTTDTYEEFCLIRYERDWTLALTETDGDYVVVSVIFAETKQEAERALQLQEQSNSRLAGVGAHAVSTSKNTVVNFLSVGK